LFLAKIGTAISVFLVWHFSLAKVLLEKRGLNVFIDVDELEAGRFDKNLLKGITQSRNFILVLSPGSLDRCKGNDIGKDWLHNLHKVSSSSID